MTNRDILIERSNIIGARIYLGLFALTALLILVFPPAPEAKPTLQSPVAAPSPTPRPTTTPLPNLPLDNLEELELELELDNHNQSRSV